MSNKQKRRAPKGVLGRLIRTIFQFYPVMLPIALVCILINAVVSSIPSIFMQNIILVVEEHWQSGDWAAASADVFRLVGLLVIFYIISLAAVKGNRDPGKDLQRLFSVYTVFSIQLTCLFVSVHFYVTPCSVLFVS